jgi:hypothetical protein
MRATFMNSGMVLSIGIFFTLMILGLAASLPHAMSAQLVANGVPSAQAATVAKIPPVGSLFSAFLGYNPMEKLLGSAAAAHVTNAQWAVITGKKFFPNLIAGPFIKGLRITLEASFVMLLIAAAASYLRGAKYVHGDGEVGVGEDASVGVGEGAVGVAEGVVEAGVPVADVPTGPLGAAVPVTSGNGANGHGGGNGSGNGYGNRGNGNGGNGGGGSGGDDAPEPEEWVRA